MLSLNRLLLLGCSNLNDLHRYLFKKKLKLYIIDYVRNKKNIYFCDLKNKKKCLNYAKKFKISSVLTDQNDFSLNSYGHIVDKLKLPGISEKITKKFTDKYICRNSLYQQRDLRRFLPSFYNLQDIDLKKIKLHKEGFILKPRRSQGSRDVSYFKNKKKLNIFLKKKIINKKEYILEQYIPGKDIGVEGFVINKKFTLLGVSFKKKFYNSFVDQKLIYTEIPNKIKNELEKISINIIKTLKLDRGLFHAEFRKTKNNKLFIIEAACRGAGSYITSNILKIISNFDYRPFLYSLCFNTPFLFKKKNTRVKAMLAWYKFMDKKVKKVDLKKARKLHFLNLIKLSKDYKNKNLHLVRNSTDRKLLYIITANNEKELRSNEKELIKNIKVVYK